MRRGGDTSWWAGSPSFSTGTRASPSIWTSSSTSRPSWIAEEGMRVFSLYDPAQPLRTVDLFVESPVDVEELWRGSEVVQLRSTPLHIASIPHLIRMKLAAGRSQDRDDVAKLQEIQRLRDRAADD